MEFVDQYAEIIIMILGIIASAFGILHLRTQTALSQVKADAKQQQTQLEIVKQMAQDNSRREIAYAETITRREESWQKTLNDFSASMTSAIKDLVTEFKNESRVVTEAIKAHSEVNQQLKDVLDVQIMRLKNLETEVQVYRRETNTVLRDTQHSIKRTDDNIDHLVLTVEAIRDRVIKVTEGLSLEPIQKRLDEVYTLLTTKESAHEIPQTNPQDSDPQSVLSAAIHPSPSTGVRDGD